MIQPSPELASEPGRDLTANEAFKARWRTRLYWSLVIAAGLHVVPFLWSPTWERDASPSGSAGADGSGVEVVALEDQAALAAMGGAPPQAVVVTEEAAPSSSEADPDEGPGVSDWEAAGPSSARAELLRRTSARPTVVEASPEVALQEEARDPDAREDPNGAERSGVQIGGGYSLSDFEALTDDERLALENLSALRPELSFSAPSSWALIRNPSEVGTFLEERLGTRGGEAGSTASMSVAVWVDERGSVEWAEIHDSSGDPDVDASALELFRRVASFRPAREGGVPVPFAVVFWVSYRR